MRNVLIILNFFMLTSCGTRVGNPMNGEGKKNQEDGGTTEFNVNVPQLNAIELDGFFPDEILGNMFQNTQDTTVQADIRTVDEILKDTDVILKSISNDGVLNSGRQVSQGTLQNLTTILSTDTESDYNVQLLVCQDDEILFEMHWTNEQTDIRLTRYWAASSPEDELIAELVLTRDGENIQLKSYMGEMKNIAEDEQLTQAEHMVITKNDTGSIAVGKVKSDFVSSTANTGFLGIDYTLAYLQEPEYNEFLRYYQKNEGCAAEFNEASPDDLWCEGGHISYSSITYDAEQLKAAASRFSDLSLAPLSQDTLRVPAYHVDKGLCK